MYTASEEKLFSIHSLCLGAYFAQGQTSYFYSPLVVQPGVFLVSLALKPTRAKAHARGNFAMESRFVPCCDKRYVAKDGSIFVPKHEAKTDVSTRSNPETSLAIESGRPCSGQAGLTECTSGG